MARLVTYVDAPEMTDGAAALAVRTVQGIWLIPGSGTDGRPEEWAAPDGEKLVDRVTVASILTAGCPRHPTLLF